MEYMVLIYNSSRNVIVKSNFRAYSIKELHNKVLPLYNRYLKYLELDPLGQFKVIPCLEEFEDPNYPDLFNQNIEEK